MRPVKPGRIKARSSPRTPKSLRDRRGRQAKENQGYAVLSAETPEQALRMAAEHPGKIHLLITDVVMPGLNGRELATRLTEQRPEARCIYISGYTADVVASRGILDKTLDFLPKPFDREQLARKVREVLDRI